MSHDVTTFCIALKLENEEQKKFFEDAKKEAADNEDDDVTVCQITLYEGDDKVYLSDNDGQGGVDHAENLCQAFLKKFNKKEHILLPFACTSNRSRPGYHWGDTVYITATSSSTNEQDAQKWREHVALEQRKKRLKNKKGKK